MPDASALDTADERSVAALVQRRTGLVYGPDRSGDLVRGLQQAADESQESLADFAAQLLNATTTDAALDRVIPFLTINETHFFRNRPQFAALRDNVIPSLLRERASTRRLRLWSAACSTGEEPYSLAILLRDALGADLSGWDVQILATDIDPIALNRAREGMYGSWSFRESPDDLRDRYFTPVSGGRHQLDRAVRDMVTFNHLNLVAQTWPKASNGTSGLDLILCRNVLIYFPPDVVRVTARRFYEALAPGSWLVVGHSEPSPQIFGHFVTRNFPRTVLYQRGDEKRSGADRRSTDRRATPPAPVGASPPVERRDPASDRRAGDRRDADPLARAVELTGRRRWREAEQAVESAISATPGNAGAHYVRAIILTETDRRDEALAALRRATYLNQRFHVARLALATMMNDFGQNARAASELRALARDLEQIPPQTVMDYGDGLTAGGLLEDTKQLLSLIF